MSVDEGGSLVGNVERYILSFDVRNVSYFNRCSLKIFFLNINRLRNKIDRLEHFLSLLGVSFDVIVLCETFSSTDTVQFMNINGYNSYHHVRVREGGGLAIFVRESIVAEEIGSSYLANEINGDDCEFLIVKLIPFNISVCATYRRPIHNSNGYLDKLETVLYKFKNIVVAGDLNIDWFSNCPETLRLKTIINSNGHCLFNGNSRDCYTREAQSGTVTMIDYIP